MDLKTIAPIVGAVAPLAGKILGGLIPFPGGSIIGEQLGKIIARQFGVNPEAPDAAVQVSDRIAEAGEETARAKITAAVEQARLQVQGFVDYERVVLEAEVRNLSDVNKTIQAEGAARAQLALAGVREHWFFTAWRPYIGWVVGTVYGAFGLMLVAVTGRNAWVASDPLGALSAAWPLFGAYFVPGGAILGVLIHSRSTEKVASIESGNPMPNAIPRKPADPPPGPAAPPAAKPSAPLVVQKPGARIPDPPGSRP